LRILQEKPAGVYLRRYKPGVLNRGVTIINKSRRTSKNNNESSSSLFLDNNTADIQRYLRSHFITDEDLKMIYKNAIIFQSVREYIFNIRNRSIDRWIMPGNNKSAVNERRQKLFTLLTRGMKGYEIAKELKVTGTTVSRDITELS
jgi:hypothetical protein